MTKQLCKNCKHLETDGMFGIFCGVGGDNTKYDCTKYANKSEKRFTLKKDMGTDECNLDNLYDDNTYIGSISSSGSEMICYLLNELNDENKKFKEWEKHIGDVTREELDRVFKMSIYEIAEAFNYYEKRIKELEE